MANIIKGPFDIQWGDFLIEAVTEVEFDMDINSEDFETLGGQIFELDGPRKMGVTLTLLKSDVAVLRGILPQFWVADGGQLSTGQTVGDQNGAMDFANGCGISQVYNNLDITSCGNPGQVTRLVNTRTRLESLDISPTAQTVQVKFLGEPAEGDANLQMFEEGSLSYPS